MPKEQNDLILEAINSAERSLALAKKLLIGVQPEGSGVVGKFDGEFLVSEKGKKYQVPPNYASKSMLVVGDVLRMMGQGERSVFKQVDKVDRLEIKGVLTKKDGLWSVVTEERNFWILPASIKFYQGEIGDEVEVLVPKEYKKLKSEWAALVRVIREGEKKESKEKIPARTPPQVQVKEEVKKESIPGGQKPPVVVSAPKPEKEKAKVEPRSTVEAPIKAEKKTTKKPPVRTDVVAQAKTTPEKARSAKKIPVEKKEERKMEDKKKELKGEIRIDEEELR